MRPLLLAQLAAQALEPQHTDEILLRQKAILPELCSQWITKNRDLLAQTCAYGRILPFAPYLSEYTLHTFSRFDLSDLLNIVPDALFNATSPGDDDTRLRECLLAVFRLLSFDFTTFGHYLQPARLQLLLLHANRAVRYLSIRILCLYLLSSDATMEKMLERYVGSEPVTAAWEGKEIDYRFLSLWEEQRYEELARSGALAVSQDEQSLEKSPSTETTSPMCCNVHGVLLPRPGGQQDTMPGDHLVPTPTAISNLRSIALELLHDRPLLLTGPAGSGKTATFHHVSRLLNKAGSLITLHLNEQSDVKVLVGLHTTGHAPGTFVWQPGVLTTAAREGRWILIEDIDRAPKEIMSALLSLIERRELHIASQGQLIRAARGFKIIATMRSSKNLRGEQMLAKSNMVGSRFWTTIAIEPSSMEELNDIIVGRYPQLKAYVGAILKIYERISSGAALMSRADQLARARPVTTRDLLKWCHRISGFLQSGKNTTVDDVDNMFLDAYDCFAGSFQDEESRANIMAYIAEELQMDVQRREHLLTHREIRLRDDKAAVHVGRGRVEKPTTLRRERRNGRPFSINPYTTKLLEKLGRAVACREPLLLVGETGTGKTTCIQHLADQVGQKLVAFNLSQQSESGDLLGGFKPVNIRSIIIPMKDEFDEIFSATFSRKNNQKFMDTLGKRLANSEWKRVCKLWREALKRVDAYRAERAENGLEQPQKKRKLDNDAVRFPDERWRKFSADLQNVEARLSKDTEAFAFAFQEGGIVTAARNGQWVLLDEINLASADTLEALSSLFDSEGQPSILLSETGNTQKIVAHPDFRVFAAMNPATDVGKKDLPPGVRSRFTELYVNSPDSDIKSLRHIVSTYLGSNSPDAQRLAEQCTQLYLAIQQRVQSNVLVDGADQKPHFSLRTLTRALMYAKDMEGLCSLTRGLYEGFHMSFCTFLNSASEKLVSPLIGDTLFKGHRNVRAELSKSLTCPKNGKNYIREGHNWLRVGASPVEQQQHYIITPFVRRNLNNLIRAASTRRYPVLIQGPTSSGKTSMIEYLAKRTGNQFVRINNHEHTDLQEYLGTYVSINGVLQFQEGVLVKALREGHWIVLDELNLAPTDVLEALNRLLDDNRELLIPETQEIVRPHENFMLFATQNPAGLYGGRKVLSRAFRNRFLELHFDDIPVDELTEILHKRTLIPESWCKRIVKVYRELSLLRQEDRMFEQRSFATLRDLFRWALRKADTIQDLANNGFMLLAERVRKDEERHALKEVIEKVMSERSVRVTIDTDNLYSKSPAPESILQDVVWTKAMRRLYTLVAAALSNNEPVLLVGETGCGKTTVVQLMAQAMGRTLHVLNCHQNTETGDIIGSQRPVRNRAALEDMLRGRLAQKLQASGAQLEQASLEMLLAAYDALPSDHKTLISAEQREEIHQVRSRIKSLFEWSDGSLVQAMKDGSYYLLDEISLADDSVLERLNSVLEPQKTLLLAEKGPVDSFVAAKEGFQFLATMNPGGDYGKRELSPALRNRFTEIWVPPLSDTEDILQIVQARLRTSASSYAQPMVSFAQWFHRRYDTTASSTVSIRDMLSWIDFINSGTIPDVGTAVKHGAQMVYVDTLGANPAAMLAFPGANLMVERVQCETQLHQTVPESKSAPNDWTIEVHFVDDKILFGPFALQRSTSSDAEPGFSFEARTTKANAMRVARALQLTKPILLEGSPGVGKTTLVSAMAKVVGMPLTRINLSDQTDLIDLFGSDVPVEGEDAGIFAWRDAPFLRAMKNGEWVLLDEMNLASQSILEGLNACLDHRGEIYISELDQTFRRHPNFRLFAAQNPHHQGGGRKGLPASFVNRFTVVYADIFTPEDLSIICRHTFPLVCEEDSKRMIEFVSRLDAEAGNRGFGQQGSPWEFNLRDIRRWMELTCVQRGMLSNGTIRDFLDIVSVQKFRTEADRQHALQVFYEVFEEPAAERSFYHNLDAGALQVGLSLLERRDALLSTAPPSRPVIHTAKLSLLESIAIAVQNAWPIILTGPAGSGKTTLIRDLASLVGANVTTFSMNADIDAMDLVGGYEQADTTRKVNAFLSRVIAACKRALSLTVHRNESATTLFELERLAQVSAKPRDILLLLQILAQGSEQHNFADLLAEAQHLYSLPETIEGASFEWVDGILVDALHQGHWLVLDNANFCSSSVLDRLNSLLEPYGYLSINEHATENGETRIVKPHKDFRIFMTTDPKYGELSRAMRNRAIELFIPANDTTDEMNLATSLPSYLGESAMYRYRHAAKAMRAQTDDADAQIVSVAADHLSLRDGHMLESFVMQVTKGLGFHAQTSSSNGLANSIADPRSTADRKQARADLLVTFLKAASLQKHRIVECYRECSVLELLPETTGLAQPINPINNELLGRKTQVFLSRSRDVDGIFELILEFRRMLDTYSSAAPSPHRLGRHKKLVQKIQQCARDICENGQKCLEWICSTNNLVPTILILLEALIPSWWSIFQLLAESHFDTARLNFLVRLTQERFARIDKQIETNEKPAKPYSTLMQSFDAISNEIHLSSGVSMEALWAVLRPTMPRDTRELENLCALENIIAEFDRIALRVSEPVSSLAAIRTSLSQALGLAATHTVDLSGLLPQLATAVTSLGQATAPPHVSLFTSSFRTIHQVLTLNSTAVAAGNADLAAAALLGTTSTQPVIADHSLSSVVRRVINYAGLAEPESNPLHVVEDVGSDILRALEQVGATTLSSLDRLKEELHVLGKLSASDPSAYIDGNLRHLNRIMTSLVNAIIETHFDGPTVDERNLWQHILRYLRTSEASSSTREEAALAWFALAQVGLHLYVPNIALDPAMRPQIEADLREIRLQRLHEKLGGLQQYEACFTGQTSSLRIRDCQERIQEINDEPRTAIVFRPDTATIDNVQTDFDVLLKKGLASIKVTDFEAMAADDNLLKDIHQLSKRLLSPRLRAYRDVTMPAVGFLSCLKIGLALKRQASKSAGTEVDGLLRRTVPLMDQTDDIFPQTLPIQGDILQNSYVWHDLRAIGVVRSVERDFKASDTQQIFIDDLFYLLYVEWKKRLDVEAEQQAANSSLYQYRDIHANGELEETEDRELFPDYEEDTPHQDRDGRDESKPDISQNEFAVRVASLHAEIFVVSSSSGALVKDLMEHVATTTNRRSPEQHGRDTKDLLPVIYLKLHELEDRLSEDLPVTGLYNFYQDQNLHEAKRFLSNVKRTMQRFTAIQTAWPEHDTLAEVIRHCDEAAQFRFIEPLAKLITKAEKIQSTVHQWQQVASREYSAAPIYDEWTALIVSWRKLELTTWSKLFDMEVKKANEQAKSWWFVAYQAMVAATRDFQGSDTELHTFAKGLLDALRKYFENTCLGQYTARLDLLRQIRVQLSSSTATHTPSLIVHRALSNFIDYHARFEGSIATSIQSLRKPLEKTLIDTIKLATYKDTNIDALRQSAKQSHLKLTKAVRKFRAVLARPAGPLLDGEMRRLTLTGGLSLQLQRPMHAVDSEADSLCTDLLPTWSQRPNRFKNLEATLSLMESKSLVPVNSVDSREYLESFLAELDSNITRLRKETPSTLTDETKETVKNLRAQKRKLFSETLKDLRQMGFKSNLGGDILTRQDSLSVVLVNLAHGGATSSLLENATLELHKALQVMPKARSVTQEHHADVSPAEVVRSVGFLESILRLAIQQRTNVTTAISELHTYNEVLQKLNNSWDSSRTIIASPPGPKASRTLINVHKKACWTSTMLETTIAVLQAQAKLGQMDLNSVISVLSSQHAKLATLIKDCSSAPSLPAELSSTRHEKIIDSIEAVWAELDQSIQASSASRSAAKLVLTRLLPWVRRPLSESNTAVANGHAATHVSEFQVETFGFVDNILAAIQALRDSLATLPTTIDDAAWLTTYETCISNATRAIRLSRAITGLQHVEQLIGEVTHTSVENSEHLQLATAMITCVMPIMQQYSDCAASLINRYLGFHECTTKILYRLTKTFVQIGTQGFCTPPEKSNEKSGKDDKLEAGTGLGEGEGAEDISKDIQNDEDLTELAQEPGKKNDKDDIEDEKDAVDMADQEMEGEMGDVEEKEGEEGDQGSDAEDQDVEEDVGEVDDLGPTTLDEKMWDEGGDDEGKEKEVDQGTGQENKDEQVASGDKQRQEQEGEEEAEAEEMDTGNEEAENGAQEDVEQTDPHLQESEKLDLPDDLNMDDQKSDHDSDGLDDLDGLDNIENDEQETTVDDQADSGKMIEGEAEDDKTAQDGDVDPTDIDGAPEDTEDPAVEDGAEDHTEADENQGDQPGEQQDETLRDLGDTANEHTADEASADVGAGEQALEQDQQNPQATAGAAQQEEGPEGETSQPQQQNATESGMQDRSADASGVGQGEDAEETSESQGFKKMGDILERWHKQQREILNSEKSDEETRGEKDVDMADADFEHLPDNEAKADAQALGTATEEQARALDDDLALPSNDAKKEEEPNEEFAMDVDKAEEDVQDPSQPRQDNHESKQDEQDADGRPNAFMGAPSKRPEVLNQEVQMDLDEPEGLDEEEDVEDVDTQVSQLHLDNAAPPRSTSSARELWTQHENSTRTLAQSLTEHLRLILAPTSATKLRGDFRTGKRLNLKRIIPYIASSYKRDKIWLRRSLPSKRAYQIMLALDDSQSMSEAGTIDLAFETIALVSKALTMLEAGELSVVGFGESVHVAHPFDKPFTGEAGVDVFRQFGFQQRKTDVKKLVDRMINIFGDARLRVGGSASELWQLGIVVSDGICDSHEEIMRLVRRAQEERIMIVFVVIDAGAAQKASEEAGGQEKKQSILDIQSADWVDGKLLRWKYMDTFPFRWYLVVRDVRELPGVLAGALRQWFREVVDSS